MLQSEIQLSDAHCVCSTHQLPANEETVGFSQEQMSSDGTQLSMSVSTLNRDTVQLAGRQRRPNHCPSATDSQLLSSRRLQIQKEALSASSHIRPFVKQKLQGGLCDRPPSHPSFVSALEVNISRLSSRVPLHKPPTTAL